MLAVKLLLFLTAWHALTGFALAATPPTDATPDPGCAPIVNATLYNASSWISDRIVDVAHTRSDRIRNRYEDDTVRHSSHVARSSRATRCSHSLLVGRRFCGKLDWAAPTQGHIYYHFSSGHYTYEPDLCVLRRLGRDEAQACMADVGPVLFAGDSVTRYQFTTLIHFLASGKYQHPFNGSKSLSNAHAHVATTNDDKYDKVWLSREPLWEHSEDQIERHRRGSDLFYNNKRYQGLEHAHLTLPLHADSSREAHLYYTYVDAHSYRIKEAIEWAMSKRDDWRYLFINVCAHYGPANMKMVSRNVITAFKWANETYGEAFARSGTQLVWKGCTTPSKSVRAKIDAEEAKIAEYAASAGVAIYDLRTVVKAAFSQHLVTTWDDSTVHYLQFMYEQWNDLLLNILCPVRDGAAEAAEAYDGNGVDEDP